MDYLFKASGIVMILFLFYIFFLRNETFYNSIRNYFLVGLIVALAIPLIEIPVYVETVVSQINTLNYQEIVTSGISEQTNIDWTQILTTIYLIGVLFFSLKFLIQFISLSILLSKHKILKKGNQKYIETSEDISPFSFFNIIIYNKSHFTIEELEQVINHEKAHAMQWHSLDTILAHLLVIILWFNPFVWLYKKAVQQNLEFLADAFAIQKANNYKLYQLTLLKTCNTNYCTDITNNFYNSLIKKRIIMLHKNPSRKRNQWKYTLLIPIFIAFIFTFNTKIIAQNKKLIEVQELIVDLIIDKNSTDSSLEEEKSTFKNEFDINLSFKGIKRNASNEITAIKIEATGDNLKAKFENSGTNAIKPIKISYDSANNSVSIGNLTRKKKSHYSYTIHEDGDVKFKGKPNKDGNYVFVSSDGTTNTWTSKDTDTIIHENKIIIKGSGDKKQVWVTKKDDDANEHMEIEVVELKNGNKKVKIIEFDDDTTIEIDSDNAYHKIIEIDEDNASENVFIIKKDGDKTVKHKSANMVVFSDGEEASPLFIIDGKESTKEAMEKLNPDNIESVNVLKGKSAETKYGEKASNGVVEIKTKKN